MRRLLYRAVSSRCLGTCLVVFFAYENSRRSLAPISPVPGGTVLEARGWLETGAAEVLPRDATFQKRQQQRMRLVLLCIVLLHLLCTAKPSEKPENVFLIHYHKTGTVFLQNVLLPVLTGEMPRKHLCQPPAYKIMKPVTRKASLEHSGCSFRTRTTINRVDCPKPLGRWSNLMPNSSKVVHFIRDPYRWAASHYIYHKRGSETRWTQNAFRDEICNVTKSLRRAWNGSGLLQTQLSQARLECLNLMKPGTSMFNVLMNNTEEVGIRFGVLTLLLGRGDFIYSAYNSIGFRQHLRGLISVDIDADIADTPAFPRTLRRILNQFTHDLKDQDQLVRIIQNKQQASMQHSSHVTRNSTSVESAQRLEQFLREDRLLQPILDVLRGIFIEATAS